MDADLVAEPGAKDLLRGPSILAAIKASGVEYILSVPDITTSGGLLRPIARDPDLKLIRVCKEDECVGIASGLSYCDKRALTLIQHTGFLDSVNAIRGVAVEFRQPICMMIGLLQHNPDLTPRNSNSYGVRITEPILEAMGIPYHYIGEEADVAKIKPAIDEAYETSFPVAMLVGREAVAVMMKRDECFRILKRHVTDEIVVSTYSSAVDWLELGERTFNYFSIGAMGLDSSHALGLALGRPDKRIICLQGDGSFLMNMGCLVTIAAAAPKNLVHLVVQNGTYEANGGHPIPNKDAVDFAAMAKAAGYAHAYDFTQLGNFEQQAAHVLKQDGPVFATLRVEPTGPLNYDYPKLYDAARRKALKDALRAS